MKEILVLGAGKIGALITGLLAESGDYRVQLADRVESAADNVVNAHGIQNLTAFTFDASDSIALSGHVREHKPVAVISSLPYFCNRQVAEVARAENVHYFDPTEDVEVTRGVRKLAQCGPPGPARVDERSNRHGRVRRR